MADDLVGARIAVGLRVFDVTGQGIDEIAGKMSTVGRRQGRALIALEVIVQNKFSIRAGKNKISAGSVKVSVEEQLRVGDDNRVGRSLGGVNRLYVGVTAQIPAEPVNGYFGVNFARVIQGLPNT